MQTTSVWCFACAGVVLTLCADHAAPQDVKRTERFVVASIKPAAERLSQGRAGPDHFYRVTTLSSLVGDAFDLPPFLVSGMPDWVSEERWEVSARAEGPRSREEMRTLLRALLQDRFALRTHYESHELPIYELVLARTDRQGGPGFTTAAAECEPFRNGQRPLSEVPRDQNGMPKCVEGVLGNPDRVMVRLYGYSVPQFANVLRSYVRRAVVDRTGLSGRYDIVFDFLRTSPDTPDTGEVPVLETALRQSLGLRLQSARGMVDVLVIESVERPTSN